jgi:acetyltransferase-like isoleucine patch superfamily enzyme
MIKTVFNKFFFRLKKRMDEQNRIDSKASINPAAYLSGATIVGDVTIAKGCKIFQSHLLGIVKVDNYTSVWGPGTSIISHLNPITIGKFCSIARYVSVQESNHDIKKLSSYHFTSNIFKGNVSSDLISKGPIHIGNDVWIGAHSIVLSGVTIGNGAVIGAGSLVTADVPPYAIMGGNPARVIRYRFSQEIIQRVEQLNWWDWSLDKILANKELFEMDIENGLPDSM